MHKLVSAVIVILLMSGILIPALNIPQVKAAMASVYIRADGSVEPSTAPIQRNGSIYTLTDNIDTEFDGIWIERSNVILDGAGYIISCNTTLRVCDGIYFQGINNITIKNIRITDFFYGLSFSDSSNINIIKSIIANSDDCGIFLLLSSNCNINDSTIVNNWNGICLSNSHDNSISANNIEANGYTGIATYSSSYNRIVGNDIKETGYFGIRMDYAKYNDVFGNNLTRNQNGIGLFGASYNSIIGNSITENHGNAVWFYNDASKNTVCGNNIENNYCGVCSDRSADNVLYHNNFKNNTQQVNTYDSINIWDDNYPVGGNYWSDYVGADLNSDGIGDTPYPIDADNIDRYPLMTQKQSAIYLYPSTNTVQKGATFNIDISVSPLQNLWAWQAGIQWDPSILECISYTWGEFQALAGTTMQSTLTINSLEGKTSTALESALRGNLAPASAPDIRLLTITFKAIKPGSCELKLVDTSLKGQNSTDLTIYPRWSDLNGDGLVNNEDVALTYNCWKEGYYNQTLDFNNDGIIDITDISIVTSNVGKNNTDLQWGVTNTIYGISAAIVNAQVEVQSSEACISVPYHKQIKSYYCGPAALEMLFDFYGPDIPQIEIADVERTSPDGTYTEDMIRAAHFSNLSTSLGRESPLNFTGYTARKYGYIAFGCGSMTMDDLRSLIIAGYPVIVLTTWHFRVVVGYDSNYVIFQDSYYGSMYKMAYSDFDIDWDYSGHWGMFVSPLKVEVSNPTNVLPGDIFNVTATITYPWAPPFPKEYPVSAVNATVTLPAGLTLVSGETSKKIIDSGDFIAGDSIQTTWSVQAQSLGGYSISVGAEGMVHGFAPPIPAYNFGYYYEDRVGGSGQNIIEVSSSIDNSSPTTVGDYDGLWHNQNFKINLAASDSDGIVFETYYRINYGPTKALSLDGQPYITTPSANNTLEYWSVDWASNEEFPHKLLQGVKLDMTSSVIDVPSFSPSVNVEPTQEVKVIVNVTDAVSGVKNVELQYTVTDSIWENRVMSYNPSTNLYEATIPAQPDGTLVKFKIIAYDNAENMAVNDNSGDYYTYEVHAFYKLTIITTTGGTTSLYPGSYVYISGETVEVQATPNSNYIFLHWELDDVNVSSDIQYIIGMNKNHTLKAIFVLFQPLSAAISPLSASINVGYYLTFTSTITGISPFHYQWCLNSAPIVGANASSWIFTPTASGTYYVYLKVTDYWGNITHSEVASIDVLNVPVGGYSFSIEFCTANNSLAAYLAVTLIFSVGFVLVKHRANKKEK
jgi:parallel beta-helix repeat protein